MMKRILALVFTAVLLLTFTGCSEKYYNGDKAVLPFESESDENKLKDAISSFTAVLSGSLEQWKSQMPEKSSEEYTEGIEKAYAEWQQISKEHGLFNNYEVQEVFMYHYLGGARVEYQFPDNTYTGADMLFSASYKLLSVDFFTSAKTAEASYTLPEGVTERTVVVGKGTDFELEGTFTCPEGGTDLPAVLLVHGVGANDRDESALSTKCFRDIAYGLAKRGIAVLRYDSRLFVKGVECQSVSDLNTLTADFLIIDDAVAAAKLLKEQPEVDPARVFIVGHDLGGHVAPRIDLQADFAGFVLLATPSREWGEVAYDQTMRYGLNGRENEDVKYLKPYIASQRDQLKNIYNLTNEADLTSIIFGQYVYYWQDLYRYDYVQMIQDTAKPVMILHGEADYQIQIDPDFKGWQEKLAGKENAVLKSYPDVNHMMLVVDGPFTDCSLQYYRPLRVPEEIIDDIAAFILQ